MTKKLLQWAMAAALICGASVFTACTSDNDDNPATPDLNLSEKIIGKWKALRQKEDGTTYTATFEMTKVN